MAIGGVWPSVVGLLPGPDPVDRATFRSVVAVAPIPLTEHKSRLGVSRTGALPALPISVHSHSGRVAFVAGVAEDVPNDGQSPPGDSDADLGAQAQIESAPDVDADTPTGALEEPQPGSEQAETESTTKDQPPVPGDPTTAPTASDRPTVPDGRHSVVPPQSGPAPEGLNRSDTIVERLKPKRANLVATQAALEELDVLEACATDNCRDQVMSTVMAFTDQIAVDPEGSEEPEQSELADRLVALFDEVRTARTRAPDGEAMVEVPVGAMVTTNIELEGLRGSTLHLSWSIFDAGGEGGSLFGRWLGDTTVYRLRPTSDLDTTSVSLWVPLPREPSTYIVRLTLTVDGAPLAHGDSNPFGE